MVVTDGPVDPKSRLFVGRTGELKTLQTWLATTQCVGAVMGARQTGKTSLLLKLRHTQRRKYAFVFVDLQTIEGADVRECYGYLASEISAQLATNRLPAATLPGNGPEFLAFLRELSEGTAAVRSILILDELGALPPETAMKLAGTIRALFTSRIVTPGYAKYGVLLAGATDMLELTTGRNSPLRNVTESIYLSDLSVTETEQLLMNVLGRARIQEAPEITRHLHAWTGGHPYWTQLLAGALRARLGALTESHIDSVVEKLLPLEDKNLPHVFKLLSDDQKLWNLVELLLSGSTVAFSRANPPVARLELIGVVKNRDGRCAIRNRIYQEALQQQQMSDRRPSQRDLSRLNQLFDGATDHVSLSRLAADELRAILQSRSVALFRIVRDRLSYRLMAGAGLPPRVADLSFLVHGPLTAALASAFDPTTADLNETERHQLQDVNCAFVVPLRQKNHPVGFFTLGPRLSGTYDQSDLEFAAAVSDRVVAYLERLHLREIEQDAERARTVQEGFLPKDIPQIAGVQIAAHWQPARSVGGDYYDVLRVGDQTLAVCIGDVVGKGMAAALVMSKFQAAVKPLALGAFAPQLVCHQLNQFMIQNLPLGKFMTFFYGLLDGQTRRFTYSNAGHNPPILLRASGDIQRLQVGGGVLGVSPEWTYQQEVVELVRGDRVLMFTDGASELWNRDGDELGEDGLIELFARQDGQTAQDIQKNLMRSLTTFASAEFADDVTMVVLKLPLAAVGA